MRSHWAETAMGLLVLALAAAFLIYSLGVTDAEKTRGGYALTARFGEVGALAPGAKVSVAGVKVGTVSKITLDPKTFLAVAHGALRSAEQARRDLEGDGGATDPAGDSHGDPLPPLVVPAAPKLPPSIAAAAAMVDS